MEVTIGIRADAAEMAVVLERLPDFLRNISPTVTIVTETPVVTTIKRTRQEGMVADDFDTLGLTQQCIDLLLQKKFRSAAEVAAHSKATLATILNRYRGSWNPIHNSQPDSNPWLKEIEEAFRKNGLSFNDPTTETGRRAILIEAVNGFSSRLRDRLMLRKLLNLGEVADCTREEVSAIKNLGAITLNELDEVLRHHGLWYTEL